MNKRFFSLMILTLLLFNFAYADLTVVSQNGKPDTTQDSVQSTGKFLAYVVVWIMGLGILFFVFLGILTLLFWLVYKAYKKLSEYNRGKHDFFYNIFAYDLMQSHYNYDKNLKKRNWKLFWLFWKRKPVYAETSHGLEVIGLYHGECERKGNYYILSLYNKLGIFKYLGQIVLIPYGLKDDILKKYNVNGEHSVILKCEGIDRSIRDLYYQPLIKDAVTGKFLDFSEDIRKTYIETEAYKDIINENLQNYRTGIIRSVETNPQVHFKRRMPKE